MRILALAAAVTAGLAMIAPSKALAYDRYDNSRYGDGRYGPALAGQLAAGAVIGAAAVAPRGGLRPRCDYYGDRHATHAGPGNCRSVVQVPHRLRRGGEARRHAVTYYYPMPPVNYRLW